MVQMIGDSDCQHPHCTADGEESYSGPNGNTLSVCEKHYWKLVTGESTSSNINVDLGEPMLGASRHIPNIRREPTGGNTVQNPEVQWRR